MVSYVIKYLRISYSRYLIEYIFEAKTGEPCRMSGKLLSVNEFAAISRTTRDRLHHYDKIGLLTPALRGENRYRYYSSEQLSVVSLIHTLQELGMPLSQIHKVQEQRSPEIVDELLTRHLKKLDEKMESLRRAKKLLLTLRKSIRSVSHVDEREIVIRFLPEESIILGEQNDYSDGKNDYDALADFYQFMSAKYPKQGLNYPVWGFFTEERLKRRDWTWPDRYYFYNPAGCDKRPAALYVVGYTRGGYGQSDNLYERLLEYIDKNGFEICGPAYEEYPLNEVCIQNRASYLMRIMITVRKQERP